MKILHIITGLGDGGAENTLYKICKNDHYNKHIVISLKGTDKYSSLLKKIGIKVYHFEMKFFSFLKFFHLIKLIRFLKPNVVQTWLVHGDLIGGICAKLSGFQNIVWNIRYSNLEMQKNNLINILLIKILSKLSYIIPKKIVVVSKSAKKNCINLGYNKKKLVLINNGFELSLLKPNKVLKLSFRRKLKIKKKIPILGNVARFAPMKDHMNLLKALSLIRLKNIDFLCVLVGSNIDKENIELVNLINKLQLNNNIELLGHSSNIIEIMNGIDIYVQSSRYGEGFPNVVAEAMACEKPCVVTDTGDASFIVGKTGWVIPPKNSFKLSKVIEKTFLERDKKNWKWRCAQARLRIKENFNLYKMIELYNRLWSKVQIKSQL